LQLTTRGVLGRNRCECPITDEEVKTDADGDSADFMSVIVS
jgi:hypothetical protein